MKKFFILCAFLICVNYQVALGQGGCAGGVFECFPSGRAPLERAVVVGNHVRPARRDQPERLQVFLQVPAKRERCSSPVLSFGTFNGLRWPSPRVHRQQPWRLSNIWQRFFGTFSDRAEGEICEETTPEDSEPAYVSFGLPAPECIRVFMQRLLEFEHLSTRGAMPITLQVLDDEVSNLEIATQWALMLWPQDSLADSSAITNELLIEWFSMRGVVDFGGYGGNSDLLHELVWQTLGRLMKIKQAIYNPTSHEKFMNLLDIGVHVAHIMYETALIAHHDPEQQTNMRRLITDVVQAIMASRNVLETRTDSLVAQARATERAVSREILDLYIETTRLAMLELRLMEWLFEQADPYARMSAMHKVCQQANFAPETEVIGPIGAFHGIVHASRRCDDLLWKTMEAYKHFRMKIYPDWRPAFIISPESLRAIARDLRNYYKNNHDFVELEE